MIWQDRTRTDPTKRKFIDENGNEQNVNIEEIESNITQNGTPVNAVTMNNIEKNLGTYGNDTYDSTATYLEGETVTHNALLHRAKQDIETPEEWTAAHWEETSVLDELANTSGNEVLIGEEEDITRQTKILIEEVPEGSNIPYINSEIAIGSSNEDNRPVWFKQGKNLIQPFNSRTFNGLTFSTDENGKTTVTGTSTASGSFNELINLKLKAGTYTFSLNITGSVPAQSSQVILRNSVTSTNIVVMNIWTTTTTQITLAEDTLIDTLRFYSNANYTFNITLKLQLEEGSTTTTYEPYITPSIIVDEKEIYSEENDKWLSLDLGSEFKNYNNDINYQPQVKINGNVVTIRGIVSPVADITNTGSEHTICNIPEKYRPKSMPMHQVCQASGINRWLLIVGIGGNVTMSRYGTTEMTTAPASSWLPFTITYLV